MIMKEISKKLDGDDYSYKYYAIGMWEFFKDRLETQYSIFKSSDIKKMDKKIKEAADELLNSPKKLINKYRKPDYPRGYLLYIKGKYRWA